MSILASFWKSEACGQTVLPDRSALIGQKLAENAKIKKFKCDIFSDFQTLQSWFIFSGLFVNIFFLETQKWFTSDTKCWISKYKIFFSVYGWMEPGIFSVQGTCKTW